MNNFPTVKHEFHTGRTYDFPQVLEYRVISVQPCDDEILVDTFDLVIHMVDRSRNLAYELKFFYRDTMPTGDRILAAYDEGGNREISLAQEKFVLSDDEVVPPESESDEAALTYLCSDQDAQAFVDHYRNPEMGLHMCVEGGTVRIKAYSTVDADPSVRAAARVDRYMEIARLSLNRDRPPKVKRVRISKMFRDGGNKMLFASIYFCPTRNGYVFNTSLPGRRPGRKSWSTWQQAIPRWVRKQERIHYSLVTEV